MLAYWADNDVSTIDRLFRQSRHYREKWDRAARAGETYGPLYGKKQYKEQAMDWKEIERKLAGDPSTFTNETFTPEEWAAMTERINERKSRAVTLEAIDEWINRTVMLPSGLLSDEEKMDLIKLVMDRLSDDLKGSSE